MTETCLTQMNGAGRTEKTVSRRDWILLPLLGLATIVVIAGSLGLLAGWTFSKSAGGMCVLPADAASGVHGKPSAVCSVKGRETALIEFRLNNCGYRMDAECGPPQRGTYRIVMMGSSIALGWGVPRERSLAALLPQELSLRTGRRIEVYNEGMWLEFPQVAALRFNEVLMAKPNMVLWILSAGDLEFVTSDPALMNLPVPMKGGLLARWKRRLRAALAETIAAAAGKAWQKGRDSFLDSGTGVMLLHYLYQSQTRYVDTYLRGQDSTVGFLRAKPSMTWSNDLKRFDEVAAQIEAKTKVLGIPLAVVLVPNRAQAAMISMGRWPADFDPYKLGRELRSIIESHSESHSATYIDILPDFRAIPNPEKHYLPVDGHPDAEGHALLSRLLVNDLTSGALPALNAGAQVRWASSQGR
jgi:hypothetical protein